MVATIELVRTESQNPEVAKWCSPLNPRGFRQFLDMAHQRGMKVIVYLSSGFFERRDPEFHKKGQLLKISIALQNKG